MKKYLLSLMTIMMVAIVIVSLVSCGGDDDDEPSTPTISVVGTWIIADDEGGYTFNADGTGKGFEFESSYSDITDEWPIHYSYSDTNKKLVITEVGDNAYYYVYEVVELTATKMYLKRDGKQETKTWVRIK